ncbi:MAG: TldD/PmbA family protein [Sulfolobales archaeon]|nr:TldD/PmbA family protein [Sulfolobales archaeon]MCX8208592.1 TldD/PmbA family protein [Sulfolobales archaeon]MDW8010364.1 TldD/PmbA family protein [Sulfolobales archaeon]
MIDEKLLTNAVDLALSQGATYAEARFQEDLIDSLVMRNGRVLSLSTSVVRGVGIRVLVGGALGFAATDRLGRESIEATVLEAISRARAIAPLMKKPIEFDESRVGRASYEAVPKESFEALGLESRVELGREVYKSVSDTLKKTRLSVLTFGFTTSSQRKLVVNSDGAYVRSSVPRISVWVNFVEHSPEKGTIQRFLDFGAAGGAEWLREWRVVDEVSQEASNLERVLVEGVEPPKVDVDVVVGSEIVGLVVHESAGHPMEADRILGREAAQAGESYVKSDMVGRFEVGGKYATVVEDPTIPGSYGFYLYDDEGIPARARYLYREGILFEPLHNRHTARVFGTLSNGAARAMNYASEPIIRMSNTYLKPGDMSFEELLEDVELGVYIKSYMEWNIDDIRWNQRYVGLESYLIVNGEISKPVRNPVLEVTTRGFYSRISGASKYLKFYPGTCGKGEPSQGVPVWFGGPDVKLAKIRLGVAV